MDLDTPPLFAAMKKRLGWLGQRQVVLARNVANADTPRFQPHDLKPMGFRDLLGRTETVGLAVTDEKHLGGPAGGGAPARDVRAPTVYETAPAGNAVVLEEQLAKLHETAIDHRLTNQLYRKYLGMLRMAATARG